MTHPSQSIALEKPFGRSEAKNSITYPGRGE